MSPVAQAYLPEPEVELLTLRNPRFSLGNPSEPLGTHSRLPRLTHNKTGKIVLLILQPEGNPQENRTKV